MPIQLEKKYLMAQKSRSQWQIYQREVIPEFLYPFKPFSIKVCYDQMVLSCNMFCQGFSAIVSLLSNNISIFLS